MSSGRRVLVKSKLRQKPSRRRRSWNRIWTKQAWQLPSCHGQPPPHLPVLLGRSGHVCRACGLEDVENSAAAVGGFTALPQRRSPVGMAVVASRIVAPTEVPNRTPTLCAHLTVLLPFLLQPRCAPGFLSACQERAILRASRVERRAWRAKQLLDRRNLFSAYPRALRCAHRGS